MAKKKKKIKYSKKIEKEIKDSEMQAEYMEKNNYNF